MTLANDPLAPTSTCSGATRPAAPCADHKRAAAPGSAGLKRHLLASPYALRTARKAPPPPHRPSPQGHIIRPAARHPGGPARIAAFMGRASAL